MQRSSKIGILVLVPCLALVGGWITYRSESAYRQGLLYLSQHRWSAARQAMTTASQFGEYAHAMPLWQQKVRQYGHREASLAQTAWDHTDWKQASTAIHHIPSEAPTILAKVAWMRQANPLAIHPQPFISPSISIQNTTDVLFSPAIPAVVIEGVQKKAPYTYQDSATILTWNPQIKRYRVAYLLTRMASSSTLRYFPPFVAPVFGAHNNAVIINDIEGQGGYSSGWAFQASPHTGRVNMVLHVPEGQGPITGANHSLLAYGPAKPNGFQPTIRYTWDGYELLGQTVAPQTPIAQNAVIVTYTVFPSTPTFAGWPKVTLSRSSVTLRVGQDLILEPDNAGSAQQPLYVSSDGCVGAACSNSATNPVYGGLKIDQESEYQGLYPHTTTHLWVGIGPAGQGIPGNSVPLNVTVQ